jgi:pimeloyl-ACP methyl ester carboxylesterase
MNKLLLLGILSVFLLTTQLAAQTNIQLIKTGKLQLRAKTAGLEERKQHQPVVILEAGSGESLEVWNAVFEQIAEFSPVLAYDRAGLGESSPTTEISSIKTRVDDLEALLEEMKIQPPYILAGNNWGNLLIREFAEKHPTEVEGMIYVDPITDTENPAKLSAYLSKQGLDGQRLTSEYLNYQGQRMANLPAGKKQDAEVFLEVLTNDKPIWSSQAVPEVTSMVLVGRRVNAFPMVNGLSTDFRELYKLMTESKIDFFNEYVITHPEYSVLLSSGSMNLLLLQEPTQVAQSIRQVLYSDPTKKIVKAANTLSPEDFDTFITDLQTYIPASLLTEENINMLGYSLMRFDKYKQALSLFKNNLENHPNSANVYDSMGEGLLALGRVEEAVPLFKKAVELGADPQHRDFELFKKNLIRGEEMLAEKGQ